MPLFKTPKTPDPSFSYERARVMDSYKVAVSNTENRILDHIHVINQQIQSTLKAGLYFNVLMFFAAAVLIGFSIFFISNPNNNRYQHYFGMIMFAGGIIILGLLFFRNPVTTHQQFIGNYTKLNLVFINYIRQANLLDAAFRQVFIESADETLENTEATLQQFQELLETTLDRANQLLDDL